MEKYSFFNSINGDRKYLASDLANYFAKFVTNGVFPIPSSNLQVIADTNDMRVKVKAGAAYINGYMYQNTDDLIFTLDPADGTLNRIDRIIVCLDAGARKMYTTVKKGTIASSPLAPTLQRDIDKYEIAIADVYIGKGVISVVQGNVTDTRYNVDLCGITNNLFANATIEARNVSLQDLLNYYQATSAEGALQELRQPLNLYKTVIGNNDIYTVATYKKSDGTIVKTSVLSNPNVDGYYQTQTITFYESNGTTIQRTEVYSITYDPYGNPVNRVRVS